MSRRYLTSEEFIQKINKNIRRSTVIVIILLIFLIFTLCLVFSVSNSNSPLSYVIFISLLFVCVIVITVLLAFIPSRIYISKNGELIVCGLIFRRVNYGKIMMILNSEVVPDLICFSGNRGFFGYWATCSGNDSTFILISERKCRNLYEVTTSSYRIYICTEKEINVLV